MDIGVARRNDTGSESRGHETNAGCFMHVDRLLPCYPHLHEARAIGSKQNNDNYLEGQFNYKHQPVGLVVAVNAVIGYIIS